MMRAGALRRLPLAVLVAAGAFALHDLRYVVVYRSEAHEVLALREHAYLPLITPLVAAALVLGIRRFVVARGWSVASPWRVWAGATSTMLGVYAAQELLEGAIVPDHPSGLAAVAGHGGWTALVLAAILGVLIALALRGVEAVARGTIAPAPRLVLPRPLVLMAAGPPAERRTLDPVACFLAGRGPPQSSV